MAKELLANSPTPGTRAANAHLAANLTASALSMTLAAVLPESLHGVGEFRCTIGEEILVCEGSATTTVTIKTRGAEGSTAVEHTNGTAVYVELTKGALENAAFIKAGISGGQTVYGGTAALDETRITAYNSEAAAHIALKGGAIVLVGAVEATAIHGLTELNVIGNLTVGGTSIDNGGVSYNQVRVPATLEITSNLEILELPASGAWFGLHASVHSPAWTIGNMKFHTTPKDGQLVRLTNYGPGAVVFLHDHEEPSFEEFFRFTTGAPLEIPAATGTAAPHTLTVMYDSGNVCWIDVAYR